MTIAACYLSNEGVVLGADSTTTTFVQGPTPGAAGATHHFDFGQKIFEIGEQNALGIVMWGLGSIVSVSYRTMIAEFGDELARSKPASMEEIARLWADRFWQSYEAFLGPLRQSLMVLSLKSNRTPDEEQFFRNGMQTLSGGFCIAGRCPSNRTPAAFEIVYTPVLPSAPLPSPLMRGATRFWGVPNLIDRLRFGIDSGILNTILASGKWAGSPDDLVDLIRPHFLSQPLELPIREAIDWVHASIYATIKTMKFSHMPPVCGGPIEIAVITTDRPFRWVIHKELDSAIARGGFTHE